MKFRDYISENFPKTMRMQSYIKGVSVSFACAKHKEAFDVSWVAVLAQRNKPRSGMGGRRSLCPLCAADAALSGEKNPSFKGPDYFQSRLDSVLGPGKFSSTGYTFMHRGVTVTHNECGRVQVLKSAEKFLTRKYHCDCIRMRKTVPFATMREPEKNFLAFCYRDLCMSADQITELTGVKSSVVIGVLKRLGILRGKNELSGARKRLEVLKGSDTSPWEKYKALSGHLSNFVRLAYSDILDPDGKWGVEWHLDHMLSKYDGFNKYSKPVDLRIVCHPANLKLVPAHDNLTKNKKSSLSIQKLKKRIKRFESIHGEVVFPENLEFVVERNLNGVRDTDGLRVLALDPGTKNFGVFGGILHGAKTLHAVKPLVSKMLANPVISLGGTLEDNTNNFLSEFEALLDLVEPDVVVIERFQTRGLMGTTVELVGFMLGLIGGCVRRRNITNEVHTVFKPIIASQWKNAVNRKLSLPDVYEKLGSGKLHHRMDALLMSLYAFPDKDVYSTLSESRIDGLVEYIKSTAQ